MVIYLTFKMLLAKMYDFPILHHSKYNPQQLEYNSANEI